MVSQWREGEPFIFMPFRHLQPLPYHHLDCLRHHYWHSHHWPVFLWSGRLVPIQYVPLLKIQKIIRYKKTKTITNTQYKSKNTNTQYKSQRKTQKNTKGDMVVGSSIFVLSAITTNILPLSRTVFSHKDTQLMAVFCFYAFSICFLLYNRNATYISGQLRNNDT